MIMLIGGPIPAPQTAVGSGDALVAVVAILLFAIAVTVALVYGNRPVKTKPAVKETKETGVGTLRKAA
jgi:hypothetical protein